MYIYIYIYKYVYIGKPYPNGRNEESSSESISAYEAVALYGEVAAELYEGIDMHHCSINL
jgi:hypothetical protein